MIMKKVKLPNFLIVGAAKSGTTFLYQILKQHPEVYMPMNKEPRFFVSSLYKNINASHPRYEYFIKTTVFTLEDYIKLFESIKTEKAIGEASVAYLHYYKTAILQIKKVLENVKIIIILRNPIKQTYSGYMYLVRDGIIALSFEKSLKMKKMRKKDDWRGILYFDKESGMYYNQVKAYLENFNKVKVYLYDDLVKDPLGLAKDIYNFLEVDTTFVPDTTVKYNISGIPRSRLLQRFLKKPNIVKTLLRPITRMIPEQKRAKIISGLRYKNLEKPQMKPETQEYLKNFYREDILKLQKLINRDLSNWLK